MAIPFILAPYVSRTIGANGVGIYSYTKSIVTYFVLFAALGTTTYGTREIAFYRDDVKKRSRIFWEIEILSITTSLLCILGWLVLILFSSENKIYYVILTLNIINVIFDISWFYAGIEQFKYTIYVNSIFKIICMILVFIFVKTNQDLTKYILIMSGTTFLGTLSMWIFLKKFICKVDLKHINIIPHLKETLVYFIPTIATSIYTILDKTLIGLITKDVYQNGYYEQATKFIDVCKILTFTSLNTVLQSRISYLYSKAKKEEIKEKINLSIDYILFISIGFVFGLLSLSDVFAPMYFGNDFVDAAKMIKLLSPVILIVGISNCLGAQYYTPSGRRKQSAQYIIIGSSINLICNLIFIPKFQAVGAIIGTLIAESIITILYTLNCNNIVNIKDIIINSYKKVIAGFCMFYILCLMKNKINQDIKTLLIEIIIGIFIYFVILIISKDNFAYGFLWEKMMKKIKEEREK